MNRWINIVVITVFVVSFTSCTSYKTITKGKTIDRDFLTQLKTKKHYKFYLVSGPVLKIHLDSIDSDRIYGHSPPSKNSAKSEKLAFSDSFDRLSGNVTKISRKKFNPVVTVLSIAIPVGVIALMSAGTLGIVMTGQSP